MLKNVALAFALVVLVFVGYAATRPDTYRVERSAVVDAPPEVTFQLVNDLRGWERWSPWNELDPDQERTYSGPTSGEGAVTEWSGNEQVGTGQMTIAESVENERVVIDLEFKEPFASKSGSEFRFEPVDEDKTRVTWTMTGDSGLMMKTMSIFMDFDGRVGQDFEKGLAALNEAAQKEASERSAAAERERAAAMEAEGPAADEASEAAQSATAPE